MTVTLTDVFTGAGFAAVEASPLQFAIACAAEGEPIPEDILDDAAVQAHFGCDRSRIGLMVPALVVLVCGVRSGKSFIAACGAIRDVLAADCSKLKAHEVARHAIVAPTVDNAKATFSILCGVVETSPVLRRMCVGNPTEDTLTLRRADGRTFEIVVVAAHRGAVTLRSRWLAGFTLEEIAGFGAEGAGAAVSAEALLRAGETRLLPNTQGRIISNPFGQIGLLWTLYREYFGQPGRVLVVHAPTRAMNPTFPQETIDAVRRRDPDAAALEYDAAWIDAETFYYATSLVRAATRKAPLEIAPVAGAHYEAAWDAATRGNGWTLVVARRTQEGKVEIAVAREWRGSKQKPLSPKVVIGEIAEVLRRYNVFRVSCDRWSFDALRETAQAEGLTLVEEGNEARDGGFRALHTSLSNGAIDLPPNVEQDLRGVRKKVTPAGVRIELARTPDGRHSDFAPSLALATWLATGGKEGVAEPFHAISIPSRDTDEEDEAAFGASFADDRDHGYPGPGRSNPSRWWP